MEQASESVGEMVGNQRSYKLYLSGGEPTADEVRVPAAAAG